MLDTDFVEKKKAGWVLHVCYLKELLVFSIIFETYNNIKIDKVVGDYVLTEDTLRL